MADIPAKTEIGVTTGPIRGSRKVHVPARTGTGIRVAMRAIDLEPGCGEPPLPVYDTSGPYTHPPASTPIMAAPPALRPPWTEARREQCTSRQSGNRMSAHLEI